LHADAQHSTVICEEPPNVVRRMDPPEELLAERLTVFGFVT